MKLFNQYKNKNVLVTGGCGFIGSHIAEKLVSLGAHVSIIDDLSTGHLSNIETFKDSITFYNESIVNTDACMKAVADNDIIFHCAAYTSVPGSVKDPSVCHNVNVNGTYNLFNAARSAKVERFVFSSTSSVYGPREDVCHETDTRLNPISPYGATKLMGELYCTQFASLFNVPSVMLRYFNVFGKRQDPNSAYAAAVAKFSDCMKANKPVTVFGNGTQTRDFVSVEKVVEANLLVGIAPKNMVDQQIFNIGTGTSISILTLIEKLKNQFPKYNQETRFAPARDGDVHHTQMSALKFNTLSEKLLT